MPARLASLVLAGILTTVAASEAQAFWGYGGWYGPYYGFNLYGMDDVPYFAKNPPVYYSRPVARPYGFSPYAYLPYVETPQAPVSFRGRPKQIVNEHMDPSPMDENPPMNASAKTSGQRKTVYPIREYETTRVARLKN
jgi:hypothetical protein